MLHRDVTFTVDLEFTDLVLMEMIKRHSCAEWVCLWYMLVAATNWPSYSHSELRFPAPCKDVLNQSFEVASCRFQLALSRTRYEYVREWGGGGRGWDGWGIGVNKPLTGSLCARQSIT